MRRRSTGDIWPSQANTDKIAMYLPTRGAIAQLGERIVRNDEVVGSIPTSSTKFSITCRHLLTQLRNTRAQERR
jgi:hypothetical protein